MNRLLRHPLPGSERIPVLAITAFAALFRIAGFGRLGLDHFDEGIYASTGLWSLSPAGLSGIDPGLIPYAPAGYPILVGLAYRFTGPSDLAAVAVSVLAGIATIPIVAWIGRRTFGREFGAAAAGFAAASMPHITFSRMALTDATFLLAWLIGIALGGLFLEKPGPIRAILLGLAVGVAQLIKYNGWLVGAVVAITALLGPAVSATDRDRRRLLRTFGWGLTAAGVAALIYWPWFRFVEVHGGYGALVQHQRGYLDGPSAWPSHWLTQLRLCVALSYPKLESAPGVALACLGVILPTLATGGHPRHPIRTAAVIGVLFLLLGRATAGWWLGLGLAAFLLTNGSPAVRMLGVWCVVLSVLTPMYHPYARLWLPLEAAGWIASGLIVGLVFEWAGSPDRGYLRENRVTFVIIGLGLAAAWIIPGMIPPPARPLPGGIGGPRDSFRVATSRLVAKVPPDVRAIRLIGRPTLPFYAAGPLARRGIEVYRLGSLDDLSKPAEGWAIVDGVQLRQEGDAGLNLTRLLGRWEIVAEEPTTLSKATLLDVDPGAALGDLTARVEPLFLLRPRRDGP